MHQLGHREREEIRFEFIMWPSEKLQQRPLGERLKLTIWFGHRNDLATREQIDPARETASLASRAFRESTHNAMRPTKKAHCLAGFRPVPLANAKSLIDKVWHGTIVPRAKAGVWRDALRIPRISRGFRIRSQRNTVTATAFRVVERVVRALHKF